MDKIEKLLRKINTKDRGRLLEIIQQLAVKKLRGLNIIKLKGTEFYRVRSGRFRIIFHYDKDGDVVVDSIRLRDEKTYKF